MAAPARVNLATFSKSNLLGYYRKLKAQALLVPELFTNSGSRSCREGRKVHDYSKRGMDAECDPIVADSVGSFDVCFPMPSIMIDSDSKFCIRWL
ncbi:Hypothetical protein NTJ_00637 [Nesidiocoris tenuis]|uniref:Uncharacterized protein n=1 Tax=Nesidiocoris tenuis TaxID=355587 RepID=A0ABN7A6I0_9HEMI|nr:Hypothetical protein NTJ_00637 [Nesidiocoris tenuis]